MNFQDAYKKMAKQLSKTMQELTVDEKKQARNNAIIANAPSWAHGTPETNPHYPYEGPAMGWYSEGG